MPYDAKAIANFFLELGKQECLPLDPMKVQKLVYFAHGWMLAIREGPLIDEPVQAWRWGPVIPSLYHAFKVYGNSFIDEPATAYEVNESDSSVRIVTPRPRDDDDATKALLTRVWKVYSPFSPIQLANMTHEPGTPWEQIAKEKGGRIGKSTIIPDQMIRDYFRKLAKGA